MTANVSDLIQQAKAQSLGGNISWRNVPRLSNQELAEREVARKRQELADARARAKCKNCLDMGFTMKDLPINHPDFSKPVPCPECRGKVTKVNQLTKLQQASQLKGDLLDENWDKLIIKPGENDQAIMSARVIATARRGWITLWGPFGAGKSAILASMVNQSISEGVAAVYFTAPDLLDLLRSGFSDDSYQSTMNNLKSVKVLVIDEMDKMGKDKNGNNSGWALEKMFQLLNSRYTEIDSLVTGLATNEDPVTLWKNNGANGYLFSRVNDERAKIFALKGADKRPVHSKIKQFLAKSMGY